MSVQGLFRCAAAGMVMLAGAHLVLAASGDLDVTFAQGSGIARGPATDLQAFGLALMPDGGIVAAGAYDGGTPFDFSGMVVRFRPDGAVDTSFGAQGRVLIEKAAIVFDVAAQPDGRLVGGGDFLGTGGGFTPSIVWRLEPDGALDQSFGDGGYAQSPFSAVPLHLQALALGRDGSVYAAGFLEGSSPTQGAVMRLTRSGRLDPSFGTGGVARLPRIEVGRGNATAIVVALDFQSDGRLVVATIPGGRLNRGSAILRYQATGQLDATFGSGGAVLVDVGPQGLRALKVDASNRIVVSGNLFVRRFAADGSVDRSFGVDGLVQTEDGPFGHVLTVQRDGKILVGSAALQGLSPSRDVFSTTSVVRLLENGRFDAEFGVGGQVTLEAGPGREVLSGLAVQGDGKVVLASLAGDRVTVARSLGAGSSPAPSMAVTNSANFGFRLSAETIASAFYAPLPRPGDCGPDPDCLAGYGRRYGFRVRYGGQLEQGAEAPSFAVSSTQANFLMPRAVLGWPLARVEAYDRTTGGTVRTRLVQILPTAAGLFTVNQKGNGLPAGNVIRVVGGRQELTNIGPAPIPLRGADDVFLVLYGTGLRGASAGNARVQLADATTSWDGTITYLGPQGGAGLDQVNVRLPLPALLAAGAEGKLSLWVQVQDGNLFLSTNTALEIFVSTR